MQLANSGDVFTHTTHEPNGDVSLCELGLYSTGQCVNEVYTAPVGSLIPLASHPHTRPPEGSHIPSNSVKRAPPRAPASVCMNWNHHNLRVDGPWMADDEAFTHEIEGRPEQALVAYKRALEADPSGTDTAINLALLLKYLGRRQEAEEVLTAALNCDSDRRVTDAVRLMDGGHLFGSADSTIDAIAGASAMLLRILRADGYGAAAVRQRLTLR